MKTCASVQTKDISLQYGMCGCSTFVRVLCCFHWYSCLAQSFTVCILELPYHEPHRRGSYSRLTLLQTEFFSFRIFLLWLWIFFYRLTRFLFVSFHDLAGEVRTINAEKRSDSSKTKTLSDKKELLRLLYSTQQRVWAANSHYLSLPRVNITSHSMKNLAFHSLLRCKMIILPILSASPIHYFLFKRFGKINVLFELRNERVTLFCLLPHSTIYFSSDWCESNRKTDLMSSTSRVPCCTYPCQCPTKCPWNTPSSVRCSQLQPSWFPLMWIDNCMRWHTLVPGIKHLELETVSRPP